MSVLTVDQALRILLEAKHQMGGDAALILSLSDSELQDVNINDMVIRNDNLNAYVEVQAHHEELTSDTEIINDKSATVEGRTGGDHECFCFNVTAKEFQRIKGEKPTKYNKAINDKGLYRVYPSDLMRLVGAQDGKKYKITMTFKDE
jgi:hypothetical protein